VEITNNALPLEANRVHATYFRFLVCFCRSCVV